MSNDICILVDSSAGIKPNEFADVFVVPLIINEINGPFSKTYHDGLDINNDELCKKMIEGSKISTSASLVGEIIEKLDFAVSKYKQVYCFPLTSHLSSTYNVWRQAIELTGHKNIKLFDQHMTAAPFRWFICDIIKLRNDKQLDVATVNQLIAKQSENVMIDVLVPDLKFLARGGRISNLKAFLARLLKINTIVFLDNKSLRKYKTEKKLDKAIKLLCDDCYLPIAKNKKIKRVAIFTNKTCSSNFDYKKYYDLTMEYLKSKNIKDIEVCPLPASIVAHVGPDYVGTAIEYGI